jgi:hypothetical protein
MVRLFSYLKHKKVLEPQTASYELVNNEMAKINSHKIFGGILAAIGLILFLIIVLLSLEIALGLVPALSIGDQSIGSENRVLFGMIMQTSMFIILIAVAYVLMRFGLDLIWRKEKVSA